MNNTFKITRVKPYSYSISDTNNQYDYYLALSSDSLYVIDRDLSLVESIISGTDREGIYMRADDEDNFLDAIIMFKNMILSNKDPKQYAIKNFS